MKIIYPVPVICLLLTCFLACRKDAKPPVPVAIAGKWYVQQYKLTNYVNGSYESSTTTPGGWFTDSDYYQLYTDGSGIESQADPAIGKTSFSFHVLNSSVFFSRPLRFLSSDTSVYSMPSGDQLILKDSYTQQSTTGNTYKTIEEVDLSK
jgi:hypothetical protein